MVINRTNYLKKDFKFFNYNVSVVGFFEIKIFLLIVIKCFLVNAINV